MLNVVVIELFSIHCTRYISCVVQLLPNNASNMEGVFVFSGVASALASSTTRALFEVMIAAATIASDYGFHHILFLTDSRNAA